MLVEFGNVAPEGVEGTGVEGPAVTRLSIPDHYTYVVAHEGTAPTMRLPDEHSDSPRRDVDNAAMLASIAKDNIETGDTRLSHLPDHEALVSVANSWAALGQGRPSWVWSDNDDFAVLLGHYFGCSVGRPVTSEEGN